MALRIAVGSCLLAVWVASLAHGGSVDVPPLGQLTRPYGGPIREYPQPVIVRLNDLGRGPIRFNPQDALQGSDTLPGPDILLGPVGVAPAYRSGWSGLQEPRPAIQSTTRQSIQRRSGSTPARPIKPKCPPCDVVSHSTAADD